MFQDLQFQDFQGVTFEPTYEEYQKSGGRLSQVNYEYILELEEEHCFPDRRRNCCQIQSISSMCRVFATRKEICAFQYLREQMQLDEFEPEKSPILMSDQTLVHQILLITGCNNGRAQRIAEKYPFVLN